MMERQALIFRVGDNDRAEITPQPGSSVTELQMLDDHGNLRYGIGQTISSIQELGLAVTPIGADLLLLASAIYAADKRLRRAEISQDGWTREIDIHLPVTHPEVWNPLRGQFEKMLGFLTGDLWRLGFRPLANDIAELGEFAAQLDPPTPTDLCLFSGGLDSFIGAVNLLEEGRNPLLTSHSWAATDSSHQGDCVDALKGQYGNDRINQVRSIIGFGEHDLKVTKAGETTERSRSFLFFSIAAATASGLHRQVPTIVPENGLISLNIPLDPLRLGAFSTRTTHPYFMARYNEMLAAVGIPTRLTNSYRHQTKGEMVAGCRNAALLRATVANTVSCSSPSKARWKGQAPSHCGHCVPCVIRRAALLGLGCPDPTPYTVGPLAAKSHPSDQAEGEHIRSFQLAINRLNQNPGLATILVQRAGPLSDHPGELKEFSAMYRRGLAEVERLLTGVRTVPSA
jgi:hypothetical protein